MHPFDLEFSEISWGRPPSVGGGRPPSHTYLDLALHAKEGGYAAIWGPCY